MDEPEPLGIHAFRYGIAEHDVTVVPESDATRSVQGATLEDLMVMVFQVFKLLRPDLNFAPAYPPYLVDQPLTGETRPAPRAPEETVTWKVVRQTPGSMGAQPFGDNKEWRPRIREELTPNPGEIVSPSGSPTTGLVTFGQLFETIVQFDCWTLTNFESEQLVNWVIDTLRTHTGTFLKRGISRLYYWSRIEDQFVLQFRNGRNVRSAQFYVRTESVTVASVALIRRIDVMLDRLMAMGRLRDDVESAASSANLV